MKRYSSIMSVLLTLALPVAGNCADAPKAPEKAEKAVEAVKTEKSGEAAKGQKSAEDVKKEMSKGGHGSMMGMGAAPAAMTDDEMNPSGKVLETMNGGGYTYANIDSKGKKVWVAYPVLETRVGDTLTFKNCMPMANFQSKTLNRTFETVLFCSAPEVAGAKPPAAKGEKKAAATGGKIKVDKADGANAYTIEEIFAKRSSLAGKQVVVRGQVVKAASSIMNTNWYHLQDGTGSDSKKTNDLTITSSDNAEVGDVVTVSGTLSKDKDFGGGYKYNVIIEKGSLKK